MSGVGRGRETRADSIIRWMQAGNQRFDSLTAPIAGSRIARACSCSPSIRARSRRMDRTATAAMIVERAGGRNAATTDGTVGIEQVLAWNPDVILLTAFRDEASVRSDRRSSVGADVRRANASRLQAAVRRHSLGRIRSGVAAVSHVARRPAASESIHAAAARRDARRVSHVLSVRPRRTRISIACCRWTTTRRPRTTSDSRRHTGAMIASDSEHLTTRRAGQRRVSHGRFSSRWRSRSLALIVASLCVGRYPVALRTVARVLGAFDHWCNGGERRVDGHGMDRRHDGATAARPRRDVGRRRPRAERRGDTRVVSQSAAGPQVLGISHGAAWGGVVAILIGASAWRR